MSPNLIFLFRLLYDIFSEMSVIKEIRELSGYSKNSR